MNHLKESGALQIWINYNTDWGLEQMICKAAKDYLLLKNKNKNININIDVDVSKACTQFTIPAWHEDTVQLGNELKQERNNYSRKASIAMNSIQQLTDVNGKNIYKIWSKYSSSGQLFCGRKKPTVISINDKKTKDYIDRKDWQPQIKTETIEEKEKKKLKSNNKKLLWFLVRSNNNNNKT